MRRRRGDKMGQCSLTCRYMSKVLLECAGIILTKENYNDTFVVVPNYLNPSLIFSQLSLHDHAFEIILFNPLPL